MFHQFFHFSGIPQRGKLRKPSGSPGDRQTGDGLNLPFQQCIHQPVQRCVIIAAVGKRINRRDKDPRRREPEFLGQCGQFIRIIVKVDVMRNRHSAKPILLFNSRRDDVFNLSANQIVLPVAQEHLHPVPAILICRTGHCGLPRLLRRQNIPGGCGPNLFPGNLIEYLKLRAQIDSLRGGIGQHQVDRHVFSGSEPPAVGIAGKREIGIPPRRNMPDKTKVGNVQDLPAGLFALKHQLKQTVFPGMLGRDHKIRRTSLPDIRRQFPARKNFQLISLIFEHVMDRTGAAAHPGTK